MTSDLACATRLHLQVLRSVLMLTAQPLLIPLANGLARVFTCSPQSTWLVTGLACYGPAHTILMFVGGMLLLALWAAVFLGEWAPSGARELTLRPSIKKHLRP
jgi:hypothetical protein